jgi:hypothetical protein
VVRTIRNPPCAAILAGEVGDGTTLGVDGSLGGAADASGGPGEARRPAKTSAESTIAIPLAKTTQGAAP